MNLGQRRPPDARLPGELLRQATTTSSPTAWTPRRRRIDYDEVRAHAPRSCSPKLIVAGASAPIRASSTSSASARSRDEVGAYFMVDMAHIAGLVAAGAHPIARALRRRRDHHHAQDPARPARRPHPLQRRGASPRRSTTPSSPAPRAARSCTSSPARPSALRRGHAARVQGVPAARSCENAARPGRGAASDGGLRLVSGGTDNHLMPRGPHAPRTSPARTPRSSWRAWASR